MCKSWCEDLGKLYTHCLCVCGGQVHVCVCLRMYKYVLVHVHTELRDWHLVVFHYPASFSLRQILSLHSEITNSVSMVIWQAWGMPCLHLPHAAYEAGCHVGQEFICMLVIWILFFLFGNKCFPQAIVAGFISTEITCYCYPNHQEQMEWKWESFD